MIIDKENLIARLEEKAGLDAGQVQDQLEELAHHLQHTGDRGEPIEIEGFGVFKKEKGVLQFTPAEILETEINNKYAGMKPIELIGAFKEPETGEMPEMTAESGKEDEVWAFDEAEASAGQLSGEQSGGETEEGQPGEKQPEEVMTLGSGVKEPPGELPAKEPVSEGSYGESAEAETEAISKNKEEAPGGSNEAIPEKIEKDPIEKFVTIAVWLLVIGITGWLGYELILKDTMSSDRSLTVETLRQEQAPSQPVKEVQSGDKQVADGTDEESSEPEEIAQVINDEGSLSQSVKTAPYGLRGALNDSINSWYTIVVHSLRNSDKAEANKKLLEAEGYRVMIRQVNVNDVVQYRVGVGQFTSIEEAQEAIGKLSEPYKSNNFIKRF